MRPVSDLIRLLVVDLSDQWRRLAEEALEGADFQVRTLDTYDVEAVQRHLQGGSFHLVVLGCASIGVEEEELILHLVEQGQSVLVLCAWLPSRLMRSAFLLGARDVADKPYVPEDIVAAVSDALERNASEPSYW